MKPIFAYPHSRGGSCSITGGYVVADRSLRSLYKRYVYADFCEGQLRSLVPHLKRASGDRKLGLSVASPTSFGEDDAATTSTSPRWTARSTASSRAERLPPTVATRPATLG